MAEAVGGGGRGGPRVEDKGSSIAELCKCQWARSQRSQCKDELAASVRGVEVG